MFHTLILYKQVAIAYYIIMVPASPSQPDAREVVYLSFSKGLKV